LGAVHNLLTDEPAYVSVRFVLAVGIILGIVGTFGFVRQRWGRLAGMHSALLFAVSPYLLRLGPYEQSDAGELLAIGLFPICLWAVERVLKSGRGRDLGTLAIAICLLFLAENTLSLILIMVVLCWGIFLLIVNRHSSDWRLLFGGISLGLFLSAFYLLPYFTERSVRWVDTTAPQEIEGFALNLSLPLGSLVLVSFVWAVRNDRKFVIFFQLALFVLTAFIVLADGVIWSPFYGVAPLLRHDLVGIWTLLTAICVSVFITQVFRERAVYVTVGILILTMPYLYLDDFRSYPSTLTAEQYHDFEDETGILATLSHGNLLPAHIDQIPPEGRPFLTTTSGTSILFGTESLAHREYFIQSAEPQQITLNNFAFEGWSIVVDDEQVDTRITNASGLMETAIPEGEFELDATLRHTLIQLWGFVLSGITLLMIVTLGYGLDR
jgi:hypothetical protein